MLKTNQGIIQKIRHSRTFRGVSALVLFSMLFEIAQPTVSLALTEGPSQPEVQSFEPINTTQMVDLFSGDFNYNVPLFNLPGPNGGYPFNLSYHAGVSADDEASWVGLGWNINAGSLVRNMRGLPDEFQSSANDKGEWTGGDYIETKTDMKESWTLGMNVSKTAEVFGGKILPDVGMSASLYFNNYRGLGVSVGPQFKSQNNMYSLGLSLDGENGLGVSPGLALDHCLGRGQMTHRLGFTFDGDLSVSYSINASNEVTDDYEQGKWSMYHTVAASMGSSASFARSAPVSSFAYSVNKYNLSFSFSKGAPTAPYIAKTLGGFFQIEDYDNKEKKGKKRPVIGYTSEKQVNHGEYFTKDYVRMANGQITKQSVVLPHSYYAYDSYSSTGQGLMGYFRGRRNDVGRVYDPKKRNTNWGANASIEISTVTNTLELEQDLVIPLIPPITILAGIYTTTSQHLGAGGAVSFGWDKQGPWDSDANNSENDLNQLDFDFTSPASSGIRENIYYQAHGEQTIVDANEFDYINGLDLALVKFATKDADDLEGGKRKIRTADNPHIQADRTVADGKRVVRNTLIHNLRNDEVGKLGEYTVKYYAFSDNLDLAQNPSNTLTRSSLPAHHQAGFKVLNNEGSYYVYGLPAYNNKDIENLYSIDGNGVDPNTTEFKEIGVLVDGEVDYKKNNTYKMINKTSKSRYAHAYMLTSIQGADYVDVTNNGPTNDDLGYWVKFDYVKYADNYKWRAPYTKGQYHRGASYTTKDDKASYQYGEKEVWYLGRAETKTHIAVFKMSKRSDSREAEAEYADAATTSDNQSALKLDKIEIYEKSTFGQDGAKPIQVVHFTYKTSNLLCQQSPNSNDVNGGKLTLASVHFTSYKSTRQRNKYTFDYGSVNLEQGVPAGMATDANLMNPQYKTNATDPWGSYKPFSGNYLQRVNFPYTTQFNQGWNESWMSYYSGSQESDYNKKITQTAQDMKASAWCLRKITLPSGGTIQVDYESDDYGYVQHKTANQMFRIVKANGQAGLSGEDIYDASDSNYNFDTHPESRRIYFKLEDPIPVGSNNVPQRVYESYVKPMIQDESGTRNVYIKTKIKLVNGVSDVEEFVSGYLPIENWNTNDFTLFGVYGDPVGIDLAGDNTTNSVSCYTMGYITLQTAKKKNGEKFEKYHPIALMGWNFMQTQAQELLNNPNSFDSEDEGDLDFADVLGKIVDIMNFVPAAAQSFGFVRKYCQGKGFASSIDLNNSCIRLASPDKRKFGGGHRVKQISITDSWSSQASGETSRTYGQKFDYTITEEVRPGVVQKISSGVAAYEPQAGGDENALKYPVYFYGKSSVFTYNNLFSEAPFNEDLFPGAVVGYRRVSVTSLNTDKQLRNATTSPPTAAGRTGGVTVHDFYTAKEFPTMVEYSVLAEENSTKDVFNLTIPIPLIGSIKRNYFHGSQAFKIELNDMHGKPKSVKSFEVVANDYTVNQHPITTSEMEYQCKAINYQGEKVFQLDNYVSVIPNNGTHAVASTKQLMGVEAELFTDQRESKTFYNSIGLEFNADLPAVFPFPLPSFWPSYSNHKTLFRTYVTNKVVHKTGILKKTKARDLQTVNESEVIAYDEKSGMPLLTRITNEFGDDFYNYNIPAYYAYEGMGHAYRNIDYRFCTKLYPTGDERAMAVEFDATQENLDYLVRGDEFLVYDVNNSSNNYKKAYFLGWRYTSSGVRGMVHVPSSISLLSAGSDVCLRVIRSGRRNQFNVPLANYLSKGKISDQFEANHTWDNANGTTITSKKIQDNVLSATASLYRDDWTTSIPASHSAASLYTENPFLTGNSGIWRAYKAYTFAGPRKTTANMHDNTSPDPAQNPKLYADGVMAHVPMFTWDLNTDDYTTGWEWVNEVTRYSPDAYELENMNRLGIYSSAYYGYNNSLSIGVAGNSGYSEAGVADFETIKGNSLTDFINTLNQTNLNFDNQHGAGTSYITEQFNITSAATSGASNTVTIKTDIPQAYYTAAFSATVLTDRVGVSLRSRKTSNGAAANTGYYLNGILSNATTYAVNSVNYMQFTLTPYILQSNAPTERLLPDNGVYYGKLSLPLQRGFNASPANVTYSTQKAHTGKVSMALTGQSVFDQPKLKLKDGKSYIASFWIAAGATQFATFKHASQPLIEVGKMSGASFTTMTNKVTYSKIVDGWQKIDIEFAANDANAVYAFRFNPANMPSGYGGTLYVDDVRVSPKTGGIMTYVYDNVLFWLTASLNADNYATLYYYDEEGNLHLKKQETEEGIFTLTESRGYVPGN